MYLHILGWAGGDGGICGEKNKKIYIKFKYLSNR